MMFKLKFCLFLLLWPLLTQAWIVEDRCTELNIYLDNKTHRDCHLLDYYLISGVLLKAHEIPTLVPAGEVKIFQLAENSQYSTDFSGENIHVMLRYDCDGQVVAMVSEKKQCLRSRGRVSGLLLSEYRLNVTYQSTDATMRDDTAGQIIWTLAEL